MILLAMLFGCSHKWSWPRRYYKQGHWNYFQFCTQCGSRRNYEGELI